LKRKNRQERKAAVKAEQPEVPEHIEVAADAKERM
jgi:hypothetical protein